MMENSGSLDLWIGSMYSGKTTSLIQTYKKHVYIGKRVVVINYDQDKRYHETMLSTHDNLMIPCIQAHFLRDVIDDLNGADVILINEGQFFEDLFDVVIDLVDHKHKNVYIAALDGDFKRQRFGRVLDLIPYCDSVIKLRALCFKCKNGSHAIFSHRVTQETSQVSIGSDNYIPLCRKCYHSENIEENIGSNSQHKIDNFFFTIC
jgi:thymidine kinase